MTPVSGPVYVVGAGRVGSSLTALLARSGVQVAGIWSRSAATAEAATALTGIACAHGPLAPAVAGAKTVILAVRDDAVPVVAGALLDGGLLRHTEVMLHCSGALPSGVALAAVRGAVAALGTLHPLAAIASAEQGLRHLPGAHFALEGDPAATDEGARLVAAVGARSFEVAAEAMTLYHLAAVMASNLPVALWASGLRLLGAAGVPEAIAREALESLVQSTADNLNALGLPGALTGPLRRGDLETVQRHLDALSRRAPGLAELYRTCSLEALSLARQTEPGRAAQLDAIQKTLSRG